MATKSESSGYIRLDKRGHVAEIVLDRGKQLNKMDDDFFDSFHEAVSTADNDPEVRVLLIWAEGPMFTAGLDLLKAGPALAANEGVGAEVNLEFIKLLKRWQAAFTSLQKTVKPTIVAIHGKCIGGGVDLMTAADIRLASKDASFTIAETKLAIVADLGTLQRITRIVGRGHARELAFTASEISAERAAAINLVNHVYEDKEKLLLAARKMASEIADFSPLVVQGSKKMLNFSEDHTEDESLDHVALWNTSFLKSSDLSEAIKAFMERRKPVFTCKL
jgi:enoyl-CoA hydratase/carnithine racemase